MVEVSWIPLFKLLSGEDVRIPLVRIGDGSPRILFTGPVHGGEVSTIYVMWRLMEYLSSSGVGGEADFLIGPNYLGLLMASRNEPLSNININRVYPGLEKAGLGRSIAKTVFQLASKDYDFVVDMHAAGNCIPHIIVDRLGSDLDEEVYSRGLSTGLPVVIDSLDVDEIRADMIGDSLPPHLIRRGVPSFTYEVPGPEYMDDSLLSISVRAMINLLASLGVVEEEPRRIDEVSWPGRRMIRRILSSEHPGLVEPYKKPGEEFRAYEDIAVVKDLLGNVMERVRYPGDGMVISIMRMGVARPHGYIGYVGVYE